MASAFLSYRRQDSIASTGRLYDHLVAELGVGNVFRDLDTLSPGVKFAEVIAGRIQSCDAVIVVIGSQWLEAKDALGRRRLDDPEDWVATEIAEALGQGKLVVPALLDGARMPTKAELPPRLAGLADRNALELSEKRFKYDVGELVRALDFKRNRSKWRGPTILAGAIVAATACLWLAYAYWHVRDPEQSPVGPQAKSTYLRIEGITAFNLIPTATVRVTAHVNGTPFHYPSLAGIDWLDVAPTMSSQTFRLPAAAKYEIRFEMETKGNRDLPTGVPYVSQETILVDRFPFKGEYNVFQARREGTTMSRAGGPGAAVRFSVDRN
ncbi:MAG: toll/interleukin-1 receptor domain-containing protein [Burkholderiales bacterium]